MGPKRNTFNNIIKFGDEKSRFTRITKYSNDDIVAIAKTEENYPITYFYGLKENGRPLFFKDNKENPYKQLNSTSYSYNSLEYDNNNNYNQQSEEGEILAAKIGTDEEEYILNVQRLDCNYELYDFNNDFIYNTQSSQIFRIYDNQIVDYINYRIESIRGTVFNLKNSQNFIYAGIFRKHNDYNSNDNSNNYLILYKMLLTSKDQINDYNFNSISTSTSIVKKYSTEIEAYGKMASCFQTEGGAHIACFYINSINEKKYKIIIFDKELIKLDPELIITSNMKINVL